MRTLILLSLCAAIAGGCVGKGKYNTLKADYDRLLTEQLELSETLKACKEASKPLPPPPPPGSNRK